MAQPASVPKFGDWDGEAGYTQYFESARKGKPGSGGGRSPAAVAAVKNNAQSVPSSPLRSAGGTKGATARGGGGGTPASPFWERKGPSTPGRFKIRSGDETPERGSAVPKFGDWDEKDPASGEGFTDIFEKVREEKSGIAGAPPAATASRRSTANGSKRDGFDSTGCSCFDWLKK